MSEARTFLDGRVTLHPGDCLDVLQAIPDASIDSCVTDPPYALVSIVKRFGSESAAPAKSEGASGVYARASAGFMGKQWDTGERAFAVEFWAEVLRVLKPGGHVLAFGGTRTYHRLAVAIEDAGFEIRDQVGWVYGSGFPKSHDVSKGIDKTLGAEGTFGAPKSAANAGWIERGRMRGDQNEEGWQRPWMEDPAQVDKAARQYIPATHEAAQWAGWGTALKPAHEPIIMARKPLDGTVAANVLAHGTGALNIDGCRIEANDCENRARPPRTPNAILGGGKGTNLTASEHNTLGRWPANVVHDGSDEVEAAFAAFGERGAAAPVKGTEPSVPAKGDVVYGFRQRVAATHHGDKGTASRFFYAAKASRQDRAGSKHPTVKPVSLMRWLVRMVTPPGGLVLDPFAGTGTTGQAAFLEGFRAVLIEREPEYQDDIARRMALVLDGPEERAREIAKARGKVDHDAGPLFASTDTGAAP